MKKCRSCQTSVTARDWMNQAELCATCYDEAGLENEHQDGYHEEPLAGCPFCAEEVVTEEPTTSAPEAHATREGWLQAAIVKLAPMFAEQGHELPEVSVSVGFPGGGSARKRIGECWAKEATENGRAAIFINPTLGDPIRVLDVLVHELVHAMGHRDHKAGFKKVATSVGLTGKMTATVASEELHETLTALAEELGEYGHGAIALGAVQAKKQGTRMLKVECANGTGYKVRMTRTWLDELGAPSCPCCQEVMVEG